MEYYIKNIIKKKVSIMDLKNQFIQMGGDPMSDPKSVKGKKT